MNKHVNDLIQKSIDVPREKLIVEYVIENKKLKEQIEKLENELEQAKKVQVVEHFEAYGQCRDSRRIAVLEKENAELKEELKNWKDEFLQSAVLQIVDKCTAELEKQVKDLEWQLQELVKDNDNYQAENEKLKNRNAELKGMYAHSAREAGTYKQFFESKEKENAELKAKNKWYSEQVCNKECAEVWGQLTKAKEIILHLLACGDFNFKCEKVPVEKYVKQAEQFIKEIE